MSEQSVFVRSTVLAAKGVGAGVTRLFPVHGFIENAMKIEIKAQSDARFMVCFGVSHKQPINQHGSFVDCCL